jgi:acyl-CoA thioesterase I
MNTAMFHFVGGDAFFSGLVCIITGALMIRMSQGKLHRLGSGAVVFGAILVIVSSTALPVVLYVFLSVLSLLAVIFASRVASPNDLNRIISARTETKSKCGSGPDLYWTLCLVAICSALFEFLYYHSEAVDVPTQSPIIVIGDSLSAGINDRVDVPWPTRLDEMTSVKVSNNARAGATCRSAINQLDGLPQQCVVIVEIGGNDLLGGRSASEFRADLDALLAELQTPEREVVMFELPLPPFFNGYGYAQRNIADKYHVSLIPRRLLASVLFSEGSTLDTIHLSNVGHRRLAEGVAAMLSLAGPE